MMILAYEYRTVPCFSHQSVCSYTVVRVLYRTAPVGKVASTGTRTVQNAFEYLTVLNMMSARCTVRVLNMMSARCIEHSYSTVANIVCFGMGWGRHLLKLR